jgi:hypothetical protein
MGKVLLIVGAIFLALSLCGFGVAILIPLTSGGRTTWSEGMWAIVLGALCSGFSVVLMVVGLILVLVSKGQPDSARRRAERDYE